MCKSLLPKILGLLCKDNLTKCNANSKNKMIIDFYEFTTLNLIKLFYNNFFLLQISCNKKNIRSGKL